MNNNLFYEFLNILGISLNADSPPIMFFACAIFFLAFLCFLSFINMLIYITTIYICEHEKLLSKISNWPRLLKFINYTKNIRLVYLIMDIALFLWCLIAIMRLCWRVIYTLS